MNLKLKHFILIVTLKRVILSLKPKIMTYSHNYALNSILSLKLVFITFILITLKHVLITSCYFSFMAGTGFHTDFQGCH